MRKIALIFIGIISLFLNCNRMNPRGYEIKSVDELIEIRNQENAKFSYQDTENLAHIYELRDGRRILFPPIGEKGLIFESEKKMKEILSSEGIPLKEDTPNPFQIHKEQIRNIESNTNYFLSTMSQVLEMDMDVTNDDPNYLLEISNKIRTMDKQKAYDLLFIPLGIFIGEKIRRKTNAKWQLKKQYGYNPYYIPELKEAGKIYYPWYKLSDMMFERKKIDLEYYIMLVSQGIDE